MYMWPYRLDALVVEPLRDLERGGGAGEGSLLVVIDALDECERDGGENPLLELVARGLSRLPPWVGVLVTSRPEDNVVAALSGERGRRCVVCHAETDHPDEAKRDIRLFLERSPLLLGAEEGVVAAIVERSESRFLYVTLLLRLAASAADPDALLRDPPRGLDGLYAVLFRAACEGASDFSECERAVLGTMAAARTALHWIDELPALSGVSVAECGRVVKRLGDVLVRREDGRVHWFHKSLLDRLCREERAGSDGAAGGGFSAPPRRVELWRACTALLVREGGQGGGSGDDALEYARRNVVAHACHPTALAAMEADEGEVREEALGVVLGVEPRTPELGVGVVVMAERGKQGSGSYGVATVTTVTDGSCGVKFSTGFDAPRPSVPAGSLQLLSDGGGAAVLRAAAGGGAVAVLGALLARGVPVCAVEPGSCRGALHFAVEGGRAGCVAALLEAGADAACPDAGGTTALSLTMRGASAPVAALVAPLPGDSDAEAELQSASGRGAALHQMYQSLKVHPAAATALAEQRPCGGAGGMTELMWAAREGGDLLIGLTAPPLGDSGAVAARSRSGWTPLHFAAAAGHAEGAAQLVAAGAAINAVGQGGETALWVAARNGNAAAVARLLEKGADPAVDCGSGRGTALCAAAEWGRLDVVEALLAVDASVLSAAVLGEGGGGGTGRAGATALV